MKIERISENQIRCTLNKHDLMERQLKISELAYGSEKAKELFRDIMEQANIDLGSKNIDKENAIKLLLCGFLENDYVDVSKKINEYWG